MIYMLARMLSLLTTEGANELGLSRKLLEKLFHLKLIIWAQCWQ